MRDGLHSDDSTTAAAHRYASAAVRSRAVAEITLESVGKVYPDGTRAVEALDMEVADGELVVFVGPSGCGKTSALRMIAGLEEITEGTIRIGDEVVNDLPPKDRDIAMIFQNYALYPHMSAYENMAFALKMRSVPKPQIRPRVNDAARTLGLSEILKKRPRTLSGGQRQRVAMGRAIVREPRAFLMDEPLSNLDAKLRVQMRAEIARLQRDLEVTTIYVTHDQSEAMTLGDRVAVMRAGELQQLDSPQALYRRPENLFVAEFIGSPAMNLVGADIVRHDGRLWAEFGGERIELSDALLAERPALAGFEGERIILGVRPEDLEDAALAPETPPGRRISSTVDIREDMGSEIFVHFAVAGPAVRGDDVRAAVGDEALEATEEQARRGSLFVARVGRESEAAEGERIELAVEVERLHFFAIATGAAIRERAPA
jgi:multiple sugar transport system ATP-binding protein